jgi:hypothetical protein
MTHDDVKDIALAVLAVLNLFQFLHIHFTKCNGKVEIDLHAGRKPPPPKQ